MPKVRQVMSDPDLEYVITDTNFTEEQYDSFNKIGSFTLPLSESIDMLNDKIGRISKILSEGTFSGAYEKELFQYLCLLPCVTVKEMNPSTVDEVNFVFMSTGSIMCLRTEQSGSDHFDMAIHVRSKTLH